MIETRAAVTLRSDVLYEVRSALRAIYESLLETDDAAFYGAIYEDWDSTLRSLQAVGPDLVVPASASEAIRELIERSNEAIAAQRDAGVVAEWLDLLPQTAVTLTSQEPSLETRIEDSVWPRFESLTNALDALRRDAPAWENDDARVEQKPLRRRPVAA